MAQQHPPTGRAFSASNTFYREKQVPIMHVLDPFGGHQRGVSQTSRVLADLGPPEGAIQPTLPSSIFDANPLPALAEPPKGK